MFKVIQFVLGLVVLLMISLPAHADTWLCLGEEMASIGHQDGEIHDAKAHPTDEKYLLNEEGLKSFGSDLVKLDRCVFDGDRPSSCDMSSLGAGGPLFWMDKYNVFTLTLVMREDDGTMRNFIIKGKCDTVD